MNNKTYLPGETPDSPITCHGCKHLTYTQPEDPLEATGGGTFKCQRFGQDIGPASATPKPLHSLEIQADENILTPVTITCKEPS